MSYLKMAAVAAIAVFLFLQFGCEKKEARTEATNENMQAAAPTNAASAGAIKWMGYTDGINESKKTGKPVMIDFYTTWCKYCKLLDDTTYKDPGIAQTVNGSFIAIKVNAEGENKVMYKGVSMTERDLAAKYAVTGFPSIWFLDGKQQQIGQIPGYEAADEFKPKLTYISSGAYAKGIKFEDYLKSVGGK
ncbi:MAG: thioredoxin fold domain-containing protein [Nitrospirota bacterium]